MSAFCLNVDLCFEMWSLVIIFGKKKTLSLVYKFVA